MSLVVGLAGRLESLSAARVLGAAAQRLINRGQPLWAPHELNYEGLLESIDAGELYFGKIDDRAVGVFRLQWEDPLFWPDVCPGESGFVHRLAIAPSHQGQGLAHELLRFAASLVAESGRPWLRLECEDRPKLRSVYESFGFRSVDVITVYDIVTCRYELSVS